MNLPRLLASVLFVASIVVACGPVRMPTAKDTIPLLVEGTCIMLRARSSDQTKHEVCATAEDLAPLLAPIVDDLLTERGDARQRGALVAFAIPDLDPPKKAKKPAKPRRRCVAWEEVASGGDGGIVDAGGDAR